MTETRGLSLLEWSALVIGAAALGALLFLGHHDEREQARLRLQSLAGALREYRSRTDNYPDESVWLHSMKSLRPRPPEYILHLPRDYYQYDPDSGRGDVFDPWGRPLIYERLPGSSGFRLTSRGPDPESPDDDIVVGGPS